MADPIERQIAIDALWKALYDYEDKIEKQFIESDELDVGEWIGHRIFVQNMNDIDRQTILNLPSAQPDVDKRELVRTITTGIIATNTKDVYSCGMRNGMRWCKALLEDEPPKFEDAGQYAQPERKKGNWIKKMHVREKKDFVTYTPKWYCEECGTEYDPAFAEYKVNYCYNCGANMRGKQDERSN